MLLSLDLDIFISSPPFYDQQPLFDPPYSAKFTRGSHPSNSVQTNAARNPQNTHKVDLDRGINADIKGLCSLLKKTLSCSMLSCKFRGKQTHVSRQL